jgi:predicted ATPase
VAIYINKDTGHWACKDLNNLPVPDSIEQAALNQVKGLNTLSLKILKTISVFYNPVPSSIIKYFFND